MRPKDIQNAGRPQASVIPQSAMFLMRAEDRGSEDNADPTDGGQPDGSSADQGGDDAQPTPPELADALQQLIDQYGPDAVREACDEATNSDVDNGTAPADDGSGMDDGTPSASSQY